MNWNVRIVEHSRSEEKYEFVEIYYDDQGNPTGYCPFALTAHSKEFLPEIIKMVKAAYSKPIIDADTITEIEA